jgi:hypothetical protein
LIFVTTGRVPLFVATRSMSKHADGQPQFEPMYVLKENIMTKTANENMMKNELTTSTNTIRVMKVTKGK